MKAKKIEESLGFQRGLRAKIVNEYQDFERGRDPKRAMDLGIFYDKWRKDHDGKVLFTYYFYLLDSFGNKQTYWTNLYYSTRNEAGREDTIYFDGERLIGGWGTYGTSFSLSNMQNNPPKMFTKEEATFWEDPQYFNRNTIDKLSDEESAEKWFKSLNEDWFEMDFLTMMKEWFKSGTRTIDHHKLVFKG